MGKSSVTIENAEADAEQIFLDAEAKAKSWYGKAKSWFSARSRLTKIGIAIGAALALLFIVDLAGYVPRVTYDTVTKHDLAKIEKANADLQATAADLKQSNSYYQSKLITLEGATNALESRVTIIEGKLADDAKPKPKPKASAERPVKPKTSRATTGSIKQPLSFNLNDWSIW